ncbi:MAG: DUF4366 domain-containing protein [Lachnospiraceae bacterium]|nr:DUF4366 domain-containing protein [Lachnospiraceae bacterium]
MIDLARVKSIIGTVGNYAGKMTKRKANALIKASKEDKEGLEVKKFLKGVLIAIGICAAIAGVAFALYKYFTPDYEDEFDDDFDDVFDDDDDEDLFEEKA